MAVTWAWVGAPGPDGATVAAKIGGATGRLAVSTASDMSSPTFFGPVSVNAASVVKITATGLAPNTQFYWAVEDAGVLDTQWTGKFHTHRAVGEVYSFTFCAAGDAGLTGTDSGGNTYITSAVSNRPIFDTIRAQNPLFFIHLGDLHYRNTSTGVLSTLRDNYSDVLTYNGTLGPDARQGNLFRNVPIAYMWDDHDFCGNNTDGTAAGRFGARQAYRECVPSYPLAEDDAIYHSFQVGRILFILIDDRFYRSPDSDPDGPAKTMLGSNQLAWLNTVLTTSTASALVFCTQVEWDSSGTDSWGGFADERGQVMHMLQNAGWANKMIMLMADRHCLGLDDGLTNGHGGWPLYMLASLDSSFSTSTSGYDLGASPGRDRWGKIQVVDSGDQIAITTTGYIKSSIFASHTKLIAATPPVVTPPPGPDPDPDPTPLPLPPSLTQGIASQSVSWIACDLVSGQIVTDLPEVRPGGPISRVLGAYTSVSASIPIPLGGPAALGDRIIEATQPGRSLLVAIVNNVPVWGGIVLTRVGGSDATLNLGLVTVEGYLARRKVLSHTWVQRDQVSVIALGLINDAGIIAGVGPGIGFAFDGPASGTLRDRTYLRTDRKSVYDAMRELMAVDGGPEWTIDLDWTDSTQTSIAKIVRVANRIGIPSATPGAVFESLGSSNATYQLSEDYSDGRGANYIVAYSSGEGDSQPASVPVIDIASLDDGFPIWENHFQPSTSITDAATLTQHAAATLALLKRGVSTWSITTRWDQIPRLGIEWRLGDDVAWSVVGHRHPDGITATGRAIGWQMDTASGIVMPILLDPTGEATA